MRVAAGLFVLSIGALGAALGGCQREHPADCDRLGARLAAIELGSGAGADRLAAATAHHAASCRANKVSADEAACLTRATNTWAAAACVPRMFPHGPGSNAAAATTECAEVVTRVRQAIAHQVEEVGPQADELMKRMLPAMQASCEQDHWPKELRACIVSTQPGDMKGMIRCTQGMTPVLQQKFQARMLMFAPRPSHAPAPTP